LKQKLLMKNKRGQMAAVWIIVALIVLGGVGYLIYNVSQSGTGGLGGGIPCPDSTTSLSFSARDFYQKSTSVTATPYGRVEGGAITNLSSLSSFGIGSQITDIFYSASDYIDRDVEDFTVECGMTQAPIVDMKPTDNPDTFLIKDDSGTTLTDSATGGASNASSTSGTLELELRIGAGSDTTTGELVIVAEYDNTTQADKMSLSGAGVTISDYSTPGGDLQDLYTDESSSASVVKAWRVSEIEDGETVSLILKVFPESGQTLQTTAVRVSRYSAQAFEDTGGNVIVDVVDSDGTSKAEDTGDYDVYVGS